MRGAMQSVWILARSLLLLFLGLLAVLTLIEMPDFYRGQGLTLTFVAYTVLSSTYLWWLLERLLALLGVQRSATFSLLASLALTVAVLAVSVQYPVSDYAYDLSERLWERLSGIISYLMRLIGTGPV